MIDQCSHSTNKSVSKLCDSVNYGQRIPNSKHLLKGIQYRFLATVK